MSLASTIAYFNDHLESFNPRSSLVRHARFHDLRGRVWATLLDRYLHPRQRNVFSTRHQYLRAREACIDICDAKGNPYPPRSLHVLAWDREDVIFIDRFQRILHVLNHLARDSRPRRRLIVDVHKRHVQALETSHGWVFESLLARLGLSPDRVMLRLDGEALWDDVHSRMAAMSFHQSGYPLLAANLSVEREYDWARLQAHGVQWISPSPDALVLARGGEGNHARLAGWARRVHEAGLHVWWPGLDKPGDLGRVSRFEPDFISGEWIERVIMGVPA